MEQRDWELCYCDPWLIRDEKDLAWANNRRPSEFDRLWRIGDSCWYRPRAADSADEGRE